MFHCVLLYILRWLSNTIACMVRFQIPSSFMSALVPLHSLSVTHSSRRYCLCFMFVMLRRVQLPLHLFSRNLFSHHTECFLVNMLSSSLTPAAQTFSRLDTFYFIFFFHLKSVQTIKWLISCSHLVAAMKMLLGLATWFCSRDAPDDVWTNLINTVTEITTALSESEMCNVWKALKDSHAVT